MIAPCARAAPVNNRKNTGARWYLPDFTLLIIEIIASEGYKYNGDPGETQTVVFYPLYPALSRLVSEVLRIDLVDAIPVLDFISLSVLLHGGLGLARSEQQIRIGSIVVWSVFLPDGLAGQLQTFIEIETQKIITVGDILLIGRIFRGIGNGFQQAFRLPDLVRMGEHLGFDQLRLDIRVFSEISRGFLPLTQPRA